ncbi:hypothetical protein FWH58_00135 [Candidatus Saccharibacteria bacterium]|nr:hypothetical protein [Candidatus Saccharibacteria bacterium]
MTQVYSYWRGGYVCSETPSAREAIELDDGTVCYKHSDNALLGSGEYVLKLRPEFRYSDSSQVLPADKYELVKKKPKLTYEFLLALLEKFLNKQ